MILLATARGASVAHADPSQRYDLGRGSMISLERPADWQDVQGMFGMPLMILGPAQGSSARPVVSVTATNQRGLKFDETSLKQNEAEYHQGREHWLAKLGGQAVSYQHYGVRRWASGLQAHRVGVTYRLGDAEYTEASYFVTCHDQLYHLKTLSRAPASESAPLERIVESFRCE